MRKLAQITTFVAVLAVLAVPAFSDTLVLKSGERISGYYEGGSARVIKFRMNDGSVKDFDLLSVQQIQFGDGTAAAPSPRAAAPPPSRATSSSNSGDPRLLPGTERVTRPVSPNAATAGWTVPTGSKIVIRMIDSVNSEKNKIGETFIAVLDEPVLQGGVEVIPRGADVRGRIANINEAGRVAGSAELGLELTQVIVNGIPYSLTTSEYQEVGESRGGQTAKRAAAGAGVGAVIGAILGGAKGALAGILIGGGGTIAATEGKDVELAPGTVLRVRMDSALNLR
jgi:hypothetical protein